MTGRPLTRVLHFFGTGVVDQMLLSGANFLVGLAMIRYTSDTDYGQFVLVQSAILLLTSAQNAWLAPLYTLVPSKSPEVRKEIIGSVRASLARLLRILVGLAFPVSIIGYLIGAWSGVVALLGAGAVLAAWAALQREYVRNALVMFSRPHSMLWADVLYVVMLLGAAAYAVFGAKSHAIWAVGALMVAAWAGWAACYRSLAADPGWVSSDAKPYLREIRPLAIWATTGAATYWLLAQSYNYVLATRLNFTAVLNINAARMVMVPVLVFTQGINNMLLPVAANWLEEFGLHRLMRRLALLSVGILAMDACYFILAWVYRDWLITHVLHRTIGDRDRLLLLWISIGVIFLLREVLQAALFALKRAMTMAWWIAISSVVSVLTTWFGIAHWGAAAALIGQISGECVNLVALAIMLWHQAQLPSRRTSMH